MKKQYVLITAIIFLWHAGFAQKLDASKIPAAVSQSFRQKYPGSGGRWEKENGDFEVNFKKDGRVMSVLIDIKGAIVETETDITINELPSLVRSYVKDHYKGAKITEAAQIIKSDRGVIYEAEVNHKDVLFDRDGRFIRETKD